MATPAIISLLNPILHGIRDPNNPKFVLNFDATTSVSHKRNVTLTKYPVEKGSDITDHAQVQNATLDVQGMIVETPLLLSFNPGSFAGGLPLPGVVSGALAAGSALIGGLLQAVTDSPVQRAYDYLVQLRDSRQPFQFVTDLQLYSNMVITNLSFDKTNKTGRMLPVSITMEQVIIVSSQDVAIPADNIGGASGGVVDGGKEQPGIFDNLDPNASKLKQIGKVFNNAKGLLGSFTSPPIPEL